MLRRILSTTIAGLALSAFGLSAQPLGKEAKIERILALTNSDAVLDQVFNQMKAMIASQMPPDATPQQREKAQAMQAKIMDLLRSRLSMEKMRGHFVQAYAETFSESEIDGLLTFYESPAGRAMLQKMPALMGKTMAAVQGQMGEIMPEIQRITKEAAEK